jgi:hypothetical protein
MKVKKGKRGSKIEKKKIPKECTESIYGRKRLNRRKKLVTIKITPPPPRADCSA